MILKKTRNSEGFTLIELLIVVAIIAVLAAAVIITITPGQRLLEARNATRESHMSAIGTSLHLATIDLGWTTVTSSACVGASYANFTDACANVVGLGSAPRDPQTGNMYQTRETTAGGIVRVEIQSSSTDPTLTKIY